MMNKKISTILAFSVIIILAIVVAGISFYLWKGIKIENGPLTNLPRKNKMVACTEEAKLCPDGSAVGRTAQNCEFAPCPEIVGIANKITISSPKPSDEVSNPVSVSGQAVGGWFSEASFPIEIYDSNDKILGKINAQFVQKLNNTWMTSDFVDFKADLKFTKSKTETGYILFKKDNPSGKAEMDESFKLPVKFSGQINVSDWKTYTNTEYGFEFKYPKKWNIDQERTMANEVVFDMGTPESSESIEFFKNTKNLTLDQLRIKKVPDAKVIEAQSEMIIDGEKGLLIKTTEFGMNYVIFNHKSNAYVVTTEGRMLDDGILSTFKFTN